MEKFKFTPKTDVNEYLEEIINVNVIKSEFDFQFYVTYNKLVNHSDEGISLRFLNRLYKDFTYFINNMHDYYLIKNYFLFNDTNIRFIDSLVCYYKVDLSPMGEKSLDFIILHSYKLKQKIFSYNYPEWRMKKISEHFQELLLMKNTKSKLSQLMSLKSRVKAMGFVGNFIHTQSELVDKFEVEIENLKDLLSLGLLPDDISRLNETEKLVLDLENAKEEIESIKKLFKESNYDEKDKKNEEPLSNKSKSFEVNPNVHTVKNEDPSEPEYEHYVFASDNKLYQLVDPNELYEKDMAILENQRNLKEDKKSEEEKTFPAYLMHEKKEDLALALKNEFTKEKGKSIRLLFEAMQTIEPPLITIRNGEKSSLYFALKDYFKRDIGSYNSIFQCNYEQNYDKPDVESMVVRINHILTLRNINR